MSQPTTPESSGSSQSRSVSAVSETYHAFIPREDVVLPLLEVLGLKKENKIRRITLVFEAGQPATMKVDYYQVVEKTAALVDLLGYNIKQWVKVDES
jgi:hypothetical protein